ncbi:MAG: hypothetical protein R2802_03400 [Flavobacteriaceae bacterium]|nr:hypothetical protein [Mangrovimonas sp.]MCB0470824.1 hypothetical protein [Flavobacteriaceae bacterium]MCB0434105.1 hypothetical protein [Mangrovimonas sp.]MCB0436437.1 hypothetical protein [Mangrovimonas sp.]MCB0437759.1 hypothetical protein [Mangrovimonas sp.]
MISLIFEIACICAGILLAIAHLDQLDGESTFFLRVAEKLKPFNASIGFATLVIGILYLFKSGCLIFGIVGILCGLLLLPQQLSKVPGIGDSLFKFSNSLQAYKAIVGDIALILGVLGLFNMNPFC